MEKPEKLAGLRWWHTLLSLEARRERLEAVDVALDAVDVAAEDVVEGVIEDVEELVACEAVRAVEGNMADALFLAWTLSAKGVGYRNM